MVEEKMPKKTGKISIDTGANPEFSNYLKIQETKTISSKITGKFFLIKYKHDENREDDFIDFILQNVEDYALTEQEKKDCKNRAYLIVKKAFRRFVQKSKSGECGEIILFHILEVFEKAMQVVNKMSLKTSGNMHYHGADAVHFGLNGDLKVLYLGESKTGKTFSDTLSKSVKSVEEFYNSEKQKFEVDLVSGNLSKEIPGDIKKVIKDYLDPTKPNKEDCCQVHAIFLGFEESYLKELEKDYSGKELIKKVVDSYKEKIQKYVKSIESKLNANSDLASKRFFFFLLPFKDIDKFKKTFAEEIKK